MESAEGLESRELLECVADVSERPWALLGLGELAGGSCYIADVTVPDAPRIAGYFDGATGDVFACDGDGKVPDGESEPAVHVIGSLDGASGQVTVRQEQGNYLRICRWDRIDSDAPSLKGAKLRTLPQCGCGGSLGSPKLFASFPEMSAYHFCAFYKPKADGGLSCQVVTS